MRKIIIGTRGSELALWQANYTKGLLEKQGYEVELKIISTLGDRTQQWNTSWDKIEGKGFFTKEIEEVLLKKEVDLAVHSHKDLPTENPEGLIVAGVSDREDPSELLLIKKDCVDDRQRFNLKRNAVVGTSSARRKSQLLAFRPDLQVKDLRGNVPTRVNKLRGADYDAILVAFAGVERLGLNLEDFHAEKISPHEIIPAPAQGVLAWQVRENDYELIRIVEKISNEDVQYSISLERKILNLFDGGCQLPLGVYCETDKDADDIPVWRFYIAKADAWDKQPVQLIVESKHPAELPEKVVEHIKNVRPKKVFVTKNLRDHDYLNVALRRLNFEVTGQSLIEFKEIPIKEVPQADWLFFSSKHAVKYFFRQKPAIGKVKIGCIGKATAQEIRNFGQRAEFIGQSTDTKLIGKQFSSLVGKAKVLFPMAKESLQSVQNQLVNKENAINLPVYQTIKHAVEIDASATDIIVFTSPSNVDAFFEKNRWNAKFRAVAMGDATASALERKGVRKYVKPYSFDDLGLVRAVLSL